MAAEQVFAQSDEIHAIPYRRAGEPLRRAIAELQHRAAPEIVPAPGETIPPEHDPALDPLCFYLAADGRVVSYAAVVSKLITHAGVLFWIAGLSAVATDPSYQRRGLGSRVVGAATRSIIQSTIDIGIFTCDPPLAPFYAHAGGWPQAPDVVLLGSRHARALSSLSLRKVVLMRLVSEKARASAALLRRTTIDLDLPLGQFL